MDSTSQNNPVKKTSMTQAFFMAIAQSGMYFRQTKIIPVQSSESDLEIKEKQNDVQYGKVIAYGQSGNYFKQ